MQVHASTCEYIQHEMAGDLDVILNPIVSDREVHMYSSNSSNNNGVINIVIIVMVIIVMVVVTIYFSNVHIRLGTTFVYFADGGK